jgi:transposase InsO family protein
MIMALLDEAMQAGARLEPACEILGISVRCVQRWRASSHDTDQRRGPRTAPPNKLSDAERQTVLELVNAPEYRDLSPQQIVPLLADKGLFVASESTVYRILREQKMLAHRESSRPPQPRPEPHVARGPNEVWSWDISYLPSRVRGQFFYLYMVLDIWSRKIVGWAVHENESAAHGARLIQDAARALGVPRHRLVLHADNGGPMKGSTMLAKLQQLGIAASFSRPHQSNDNAFSESLFRTVKYRPDYPRQPFASIEAAREWVARFVRWYNTEHLHSALRFVTPDDRHEGRDAAILARRAAVYAAARKDRPERWTQGTRNWEPVGAVHLNPGAAQRTQGSAA